MKKNQHSLSFYPWLETNLKKTISTHVPEILDFRVKM